MNSLGANIGQEMDISVTGRRKVGASAWAYFPVLLSALIMLPRLRSAQFGLLDDGRTLTVARSILSGDMSGIWEPASGRSRPIYWLSNALVYALAGPNPFWFFLANLVIFVLITAGLIWLVRRAGGSRFQAFGTGLLFVASGPIVENFYTLSKPEPLQAFWILAAILLASHLVRPILAPRNVLLIAGVAGLILLASLTKETAIVILPISLAWLGFVRWSRMGQEVGGIEPVALGLVIGSGLAGIAFAVLRLTHTAIISPVNSYAGNYAFGASQLGASAVRWTGWLLYDSVWLLPLLAYLGFVAVRRGSSTVRFWIAGGLIWILAWLAIYLPWKYAVEYYLLPVAMAEVTIGGVALREICRSWPKVETSRRILAGAVLAAAAILLSGTVMNNVTNARVQLAVDSANHDLLDYIGRAVPAGSLVLVNIQEPNEYVDELKLQVVELEGRPDLRVMIFSPKDGKPPGASKPTFVATPAMANEPSLSVRMGVVETTATAWNESLAATLGPSLHQVYRSHRTFHLLIVDYPRAICPLTRSIPYCRESKPVIDRRIFEYGWDVYGI